jgi:hypothetical protein
MSNDLWKTGYNIEKKAKKYFSKKNFTKSLPEKKEFATFAPANRKTSKQKKVRHVPRHIELTAVPKEISEHK